MKGIILGTVLVGLASTSFARPELNAFINKPANTIPELIAQIKSDKQVADRFMRHFSMTKEEVLEYVGSLHLGSLQKSDYYTIYSAPENGIIKCHIGFYKKGTPAFVDADGNPILRVKCANPFVGGPVKPYSKSEPSVSAGGDVIPPTVDTVPSNDIFVDVPPTTTEFDVENPITLKTTPVSSSPNVFAGNSIASVLGLGGAAIFVNRGHSTPTPEPASMLAVAVGVGLLARRRKKK